MGYTILSKLLCFLSIVFVLSFGLVLNSKIAVALDCSKVNPENTDECNYILDSELTQEEKEMLILNLIYFSNKPDFSFVNNWNNNLVLNKEGINSGIIKNAWVKIKDINPSLIEDFNLFTNGSGNILSDFNYNIELPSRTQPNDCRTDYRLTSDNTQLSIFINDNLTGNDKLVSFNNINQDSIYKAKLDINANYEVDHYRTNTYCCRFRRGRCIQYCESCDFYSRDAINDHVTLYEQKNFKYYNRISSINFKIKDKNYDSNIIEIEADNYTSLEINFENSYYKEFKYDYSLNIGEDSLLTQKAKSKDNIEKKNLIAYYEDDKLILVVDNTNNCQIKIRNHFTEYIKDCNLEFEDLNLKINTNKLSYNNGEVIQINVEPKDETVKLIYGNQVIEAVNNAQFISNVNYNKIIAEYNNKKYEKVIYVNDKDNWNVIVRLPLFSLFAFLVYDYSKKKFKELE